MSRVGLVRAFLGLSTTPQKNGAPNVNTTQTQTPTPTPTPAQPEAPKLTLNRAQRRQLAKQLRAAGLRLVVFGNPIPEPTSDRDTLRKQADIIDLIDERQLPYQVTLPELLRQIDIEQLHDAEYVQAVIDGSPRYLADSPGFPWHPGRYREVLISTSAVVAAVQHALANRVNAGCTSSGLHHAGKQSGAGFCTFNGLAIAAVKAVEAGAKRVLILDLDAHCGGGTAHLIAGREGIEQVDVSVHAFDGYTDIENARLYMAGGDNYLEVIAEALANIDDPESIDVVIYNAGMDPHEHAGGVWGITTEVLAERERMVFEWANSRGIPVAFTLAGGYTHGATRQELAELHLLTFEQGHTSTPIAR
jgi:acetoin utilization deacetylase AcuC-like enzyme